jgi:hypothetical protein
MITVVENYHCGEYKSLLSLWLTTDLVFNDASPDGLSIYFLSITKFTSFLVIVSFSS